MAGLLADRSPGLPKTLREEDPDFVPLDGTLAECDRVGDSRADYSAKQRRHDVNVQIVTDPAGEILWISPALPGRTHDLTAARTHHVIRICERQGVPILADLACQGTGPWAYGEFTAYRIRYPSHALPRGGARAVNRSRQVCRPGCGPCSWSVRG